MFRAVTNVESCLQDHTETSNGLRLPTMVYTGPSKGCATCKSRHIKCDEGRPSCNRCLRRGLACPGYPQEEGIRFEDETSRVVERGERLRQRAPQRVPSSSSSRSCSTVGLPWSVDTDTETTAVTFFLTHYTPKHGEIVSNRFFFDLLGPRYEAASPSSAIALATATVAVENFKRWSGRTTETDLSDRLLGRALKAITEALSDPDESVADDTLIAVLLLHFHACLKMPLSISSALGSHQIGVRALVEHRGRRNLRSPLATRLLRTARHALVHSAVSSGTYAGVSGLVWQEQDGPTQSPGTQLDWMGAEVADLQADCYKVEQSVNRYDIQGAGSSIDEVGELHSRAVSLDHKLLRWANERSGEWLPQRISASSIPTSVIQAGVYRDMCDSYTSLRVVDMWNDYRVYRLGVLRVLLSCSAARSSRDSEGSSDFNTHLQAPESYRHSGQVVQTLIDETCASVPYQLGNRTEGQSMDDFGRLESFDFLVPKTDSIHGSPNAAGVNAPLAESKNFGAESRQRHLCELLTIGHWLVFTHVTLMITFVTAENNGTIRAMVRDGQIDWMQEQLKRVLHVNNCEKEENRLLESLTGTAMSERRDCARVLKEKVATMSMAEL